VSYQPPTNGRLLELLEKNEEAAMPVVNTKQSFFEQLTHAIYLDRVLKIVGVAAFALTYINAWHALSFGHKFGFVAGAAAWFVGARFTKIYR
jgi:hypothetical protein